jgi:hypothetical protein
MTTVIVINQDSPSRATCPTFYQTDTGDYYIQGDIVTDPAVLHQMDIPDHETVVKVTPGLVRMIAAAVSDGHAGEVLISTTAR